MKKVSLRASFAIIMALLVIVGLVLYVFRFVQDGEKWALYFDESTSKCTYTLRDRDGTVLAKMGGGSRTYAESSKVRTACYQLIGDFNGNVGTVCSSAHSPATAASMLRALPSPARVTTAASL